MLVTHILTMGHYKKKEYHYDDIHQIVELDNHHVLHTIHTDQTRNQKRDNLTV